MASTNGRMKRKSWKVISIHFWFRFSGTHTTKEFELNEWIKIDTDIELHSNCPMVVQRDFVSRRLLLLPPLLLFYMCAWFTFLDFFFFFVWWTVERAHTGNNKHFSTCDWSEKGAHKRKRSFSFHHAKSKRVKYIGLNRMNWMCIKTSIFIHLLYILDGRLRISQQQLFRRIAYEVTMTKAELIHTVWMAHKLRCLKSAFHSDCCAAKIWSVNLTLNMTLSINNKEQQQKTATPQKNKFVFFSHSHWTKTKL